MLSSARLELEAWAELGKRENYPKFWETFWTFWHKLDCLCLAPEILSCPIYPHIGALHLVLWLWQCQVPVQHCLPITCLTTHDLKYTQGGCIGIFLQRPHQTKSVIFEWHFKGWLTQANNIMSIFQSKDTPRFFVTTPTTRQLQHLQHCRTVVWVLKFWF